MENLALKNILITFLQDNEREINRAVKEIEKLDTEYENMEFKSLQTEINYREVMRGNANKLFKDIIEPRHISEWHEDMGDKLWWVFPIEEPPYCGSPLDSDFPNYVTHFTGFILPNEPR